MDRELVSAVRSPFPGNQVLWLNPAESSGRLDSVHRRDTFGQFSGKGPHIFHDLPGWGQGGGSGEPEATQRGPRHAKGSQKDPQGSQKGGPGCQKEAKREAKEVAKEKQEEQNSDKHYIL